MVRQANTNINASTPKSQDLSIQPSHTTSKPATPPTDCLLLWFLIRKVRTKREGGGEGENQKGGKQP